MVRLAGLAVIGAVLLAALGCDKDYVGRPTEPVVGDKDTVFIEVPCEPETVYVEVDDRGNVRGHGLGSSRR